MPTYNICPTRRGFLGFGLLAFCPGKMLPALGANSVYQRVVGSSLVVVYSHTPSWIDEVRNAVVRELGPPCDGPAWVKLYKYDADRIQWLIDAGVRLIEISGDTYTTESSVSVWRNLGAPVSILESIKSINNK